MSRKLGAIQSSRRATPRNAAASAMTASCGRPLRTRECSLTGRLGSSGSPNLSPTTSIPKGNTRRAKAETPKPAVTAADENLGQGMPASSRRRPAMIRTPEGSADFARGSGSSDRCCQLNDAHQLNFSRARTSPSGWNRRSGNLVSSLAKPSLPHPAKSTEFPRSQAAIGQALRRVHNVSSTIPVARKTVAER